MSREKLIARETLPFSKAPLVMWCECCQKETLTDAEFRVSGMIEGEPTVDKEPICARCRRPR